MPEYKDQTGRSVLVSEFPERIISLVPSQTELLYDLGLNERVVGITKFCVHPEAWHQSKKRVGGTKNLLPETIQSLQPDLIIANKEENEQVQVEELAKKYPVWISDIKTLSEAKRMMLSVAEMTSTLPRVYPILQVIDKAFDELALSLKLIRHRKACYFIWKDPFMCAGGDTFINSMMGYCNFSNIFNDNSRYPKVAIQEIKALQPEIILLSSEPFPFKEKQREQIQIELREAKVVLVDGEMFSWYGSRLIKTPGNFLQLLERIESVN